MMMWETWQWFAIYIPNAITFIGYIIILISIVKSEDLEKSPKKNRFLMAAFIATCCLHHGLHIPFMYYDMFTTMLIVDLVMAYVCIIAVKNLDF